MEKFKGNAVNWFELPVRQFERAVTFYQTVLGAPLKAETIGGKRLAVFPYEQPGVGGCVMEGDGFSPSDSGALVYLNAGASIDRVLDRVTTAGGRVTLAKTALPPGMGFFAHIIDSEGNRVGLHAPA